MGFHTNVREDTFRRVAVTVSERFSSDATHGLSVLGSVVATLGVLFCCLMILIGRMCCLTLTAAIGEVGTMASWLSTQ